MTAAQFIRRLMRWLMFPGPIRKAKALTQAAPTVFTTGPELIERIIRAVELNQSVVLSGPRGCGKSFCVEEAIKLAGERAVIPKGAKRFLQGNRETPRDYLIEDEIAFRCVTNNGTVQVIPYRRSSPLFAFADRDSQTGDPIMLDRDSKKVPCVMKDHDEKVITENGKPVSCNKFVLFLDEINRFSDGVLDALLSVLEERKAVLAGKEYVLPVVVLMTMNPPGYDGSARKLSPPLAARIGRTYRLCTPDLNTLSDRIIQDKVDALRQAYKEGQQAKPEDKRGPLFPPVSVDVIRKVGLLTLLCWGDISQMKPGTEYLTPDTQAQLRQVMAEDKVARTAMKDLAELCQFGPDGRAGSDWLTNAIGLALIDAELQEAKEAVLRDEHLVRTVIETVSHKIYDSFSQAARPDLVARKEWAVNTLCRQVFHRPLYHRLVSRIVDSPRLESAFATVLPEVGFDKLNGLFHRAGVTADKPVTLSGLFRKAGVTDDKPVIRWMNLVAGMTTAATADQLFARLTGDKFLVPADTLASPVLPAGFRTVPDNNLARSFAKKFGRNSGNSQLLGVLLDDLLHQPMRIGPHRRPIDEELADSHAVCAVGVDKFLKLCQDHRLGEERRSLILVVARHLEALWAVRVRRGRENETAHEFMTELTGVTLEGRPAAVPVPLILDLMGPVLAAVANDRESEVPAYIHFLNRLRDELTAMQKAAKKPGKGSP